MRQSRRRPVERAAVGRKQAERGLQVKEERLPTCEPEECAFRSKTTAKRQRLQRQVRRGRRRRVASATRRK
eukprot:8741507-Pyramimonas_sp.AAC.1